MFVLVSDGVVILTLPWKPKQRGIIINYCACFGGKQRGTIKLSQQSLRKYKCYRSIDINKKKTADVLHKYNNITGVLVD